MMIACLYGAGREFTVEHVRRFVAQVRPHVPRETPIVCMTDAPAEVHGLVDHIWWLPAEHRAWGWQGCWPKLSLLGYPGPLLYLDLDVNVVGDLAPLCACAAQHRLIMCRDFWGCDPPLANGSVIGWSGSLAWLCRAFERDPEAGRQTDGTVAQRHWSDQIYILNMARAAGYDVQWWQELVPGSVRSFKREVVRGAALDRTAIIASHGRPRPWDLDGADQWLARLSRG